MSHQTAPLPGLYVLRFSSTDKNEFSGLHIAARLKSIEVDARGKSCAVEPHFVVASLHIAINQLRHLLAEGGEDRYKDM